MFFSSGIRNMQIGLPDNVPRDVRVTGYFFGVMSIYSLLVTLHSTRNSEQTFTCIRILVAN